MLTDQLSSWRADASAAPAPGRARRLFACGLTLALVLLLLAAPIVLLTDAPFSTPAEIPLVERLESLDAQVRTLAAIRDTSPLPAADYEAMLQRLRAVELERDQLRARDEDARALARSLMDSFGRARAARP